jgi:hypothetical protein
LAIAFAVLREPEPAPEAEHVDRGAREREPAYSDAI